MSVSVDSLLGKNLTLAGKYSTADVSGIDINSGLLQVGNIGSAQSNIE